MIELRCLGPLTVTVDGNPPPPALLWRKHLALLVYLALSPRGRTRDHLTGLLWPEKDESRARHSLNEALRVLRRSLGTALLSSGDRIHLAAGVVETDLNRPVVEGVAGEFLEGFTVPDCPEFERWLSGERDRVRREVIEALLEVGQAALSSGQAQRAADHATRALALEGGSEPAVRLGMRALAVGGRRSEALALFARHASYLAQIGAEADPEVVRLADRVRAATSVRGPSGERAVWEGRTQVVPLVGAGARALGRLIDLWSNARRGPGRAVVIVGDAGTGKTRLSDEVASRAHLDGAVVAAARARRGDTPQELWGAVIRGGLLVPELGSAPTEALAGLLQAYPDLGALYPPAREVGALPFRAALTAVLDALADVRPVLLSIDDAHLASQPAVETLSVLAERARSGRLCVLLTSRPSAGGLEDLISRLGRETPGEVLRLAEFSAGDIEDLIRSLLPHYDAPAAARLARRALADSGGNPFLAVELLRAVRDGLELGPESRDRAWPAADRTLDQTLPSELPASVGAALRLRYRVLSDRAQQALVAAAVLGTPVTADRVGRALSVEPGQVEGALDELEWERWLAGDARGYSFVTRLAQQVILGDMVTAGQKRRMLDRAGRESGVD